MGSLSFEIGIGNAGNNAFKKNPESFIKHL
jgi:hypothetical protein